VQGRDALRDHLEAQDIGTGIHYKIAGHQQPALQQHAHRTGDMTVTESVCRRLLSLPMYPQLTAEQIKYVAGQVLAFLHGRSPSAKVEA
jgi:dTDP-4-amino-4,6-dideoxygalactose transaminase